LDERARVNHWIQSLTGSKDAALDQDGIYRLVAAKDVNLSLLLPKDSSRLMVMADLLRIDDPTPETLREIAALNIRFEFTGGMTLALEESTSTVLAFIQCTPGSLDVDSFRTLLEAVEIRVVNLRANLHAALTATQLQPASALHQPYVDGIV
jgi:hypothetical protein